MFTVQQRVGVTKLRVEISIFMKNAHIFMYKVVSVAVNIVETVCTYTFTVVIWLLAVRCLQMRYSYVCFSVILNFIYNEKTLFL